MDIQRRSHELALASALCSYPDEEVEATIADLAPALSGLSAAAPFVAALARPEGFDELRHAYVDLFDRGEAKLPLYETEYGRMRALGKGRELADISGFYQAFGLRLDEEMHEMLDHVSVELEFYALLLAKQAHLDARGDGEGGEIVADARRKFLKAHLGPLARGLADRLGRGPARPTYGEVLSWAAALVEAECAEAGVVLEELDVAEIPEDREDVACGNVHLPVVG